MAISDLRGGGGNKGNKKSGDLYREKLRRGSHGGEIFI